MEKENKFKPSTQNTMEIREIIIKLNDVRNALWALRDSRPGSDDEAIRMRLLSASMRLTEAEADLKDAVQRLAPWEG